MLADLLVPLGRPDEEPWRWTVGMMVTARRTAEDGAEVRYEFGLDRRYDRVLVIDTTTWVVRVEDGNFDSATGAIVTKMKKFWQEHGEFPPAATFAS